MQRILQVGLLLGIIAVWASFATRRQPQPDPIVIRGQAIPSTPSQLPAGALYTPFPTSAETNPGYHWVNGYFRRNGTYVEGHYQTNANGAKGDNWSTLGNVNPFTGKAGTK